MVNVHFPGASKVVTIGNPVVVHDRLNVYHVTIPMTYTPSIKDIEGIKFWIDDVPSRDAKLTRTDYDNGRVSATFVVLLETK